MPLKVYELTAPAEAPSIFTSAVVYPVVGVIAKVWLLPPLTLTLPNGEIDPPVPALEVMV